MATYNVDVELEPWPEGGFVARAPALQGCWVVAPTREQALAHIYEGIEMHIAARLRRGEPLPVEEQRTRYEPWRATENGWYALIPRHDQQEAASGTLGAILSDLGIDRDTFYG